MFSAGRLARSSRVSTERSKLRVRSGPPDVEAHAASNHMSASTTGIPRYAMSTVRGVNYLAPVGHTGSPRHARGRHRPDLQPGFPGGIGRGSDPESGPA